VADLNRGLGHEAAARYAFVRGLVRRVHPPGSRIVEFGAAPGDQIARLQSDGYTTTAVDHGIASDEWGPGEEGRMRALFAEAGVEFVMWDLEVQPYPLPSESFDAVIFTEVFEHLREYPIRSLHEAFRVLKPGGRIYLTTPNTAYLLNRLRLMAGRSVATPLRDWIGGLPFARHAREYTFAEMQELLDLAGFDPVLRTSRHFHTTIGRRGAIARVAKEALGAISRLRPTLGPEIIIVAERRPAPGAARGDEVSPAERPRRTRRRSPMPPGSRNGSPPPMPNPLNGAPPPPTRSPA
jgi:SAM-dependent methyltransferase